MTKLAIVLASMLLIVALVAGCGKSKRTHVSKDGGKVTVTTEGSPRGESGKIEIESEEGNFSVSHDADKTTISEAELGALVYPGARVERTSEFEGHTIYCGRMPPVMTIVVLATPDSFEKVKTFYKSRLKGGYSRSVSDEESQKITMYYGRQVPAPGAALRIVRAALGSSPQGEGWREGAASRKKIVSAKLNPYRYRTDEDSLNITIRLQKDGDHTKIVVIKRQKLSPKG